MYSNYPTTLGIGIILHNRHPNVIERSELFHGGKVKGRMRRRSVEY